MMNSVMSSDIIDLETSFNYLKVCLNGSLKIVNSTFLVTSDWFTQYPNLSLRRLWILHEEEYKKTDKRPSILVVLFRLFWFDVLVDSILLILSLVPRIIQPLLLGNILTYFSSTTVTKSEAHWYIILLVISNVLSAILSVQYKFSSCITAMKIRITCSTCIHRKVSRNYSIMLNNYWLFFIFRYWEWAQALKIMLSTWFLTIWADSTRLQAISIMFGRHHYFSSVFWICSTMTWEFLGLLGYYGLYCTWFCRVSEYQKHFQKISNSRSYPPILKIFLWKVSCLDGLVPTETS